MKFLPFDEDDLKKLDLLIRREDYFTAPDRRARWREKVKLDPEKRAEMSKRHRERMQARRVK